MANGGRCYDDAVPRPFVTLRRRAWAALAHNTQIDLDEATLATLRGIGDPTDQSDVEEVYRPLTQLLHLYMANTGRLYDQSNQFLRLRVQRTPFVIAVAGSVAVGKSTVSRLLQELLRRAPGNPKVDLVTTDGFLYPNAELERRGLLDRKGFPESYNRRALLNFLIEVKSGSSPVEAPVYSHSVYDIVPEQKIIVDEPDILILEGLNVLQPARVEADGTAGLAVSDFIDFSVFVDADEAHIKSWFLDRFMELRRRAADKEDDGFFSRYTSLTDEEALSFGSQVWESINGPNLRQNIAPTRDRATAILQKGPDHIISSIRIRKI
ncbi:MAG: type I pantothenate kinase [Tessaracoccus sp.]